MLYKDELLSLAKIYFNEFAPFFSVQIFGFLQSLQFVCHRKKRAPSRAATRQNKLAPTDSLFRWLDVCVTTRTDRKMVIERQSKTNASWNSSSEGRNAGRPKKKSSAVERKWFLFGDHTETYCFCPRVWICVDWAVAAQKSFRNIETSLVGAVKLIDAVLRHGVPFLCRKFCINARNFV